MHRRLESELLPMDIEIERTLRNLNMVKAAEKAVFVEQKGTDQHIPTELVAEIPQR